MSFSSTQSFTKDIFNRLKQINNDILVHTKKINDNIENNNTEIKEKMLIIENKLDILIKKIDENENKTFLHQEKQKSNDDLLQKLENIKINDCTTNTSFINKDDVTDYDSNKINYDNTDINNTNDAEKTDDLTEIENCQLDIQEEDIQQHHEIDEILIL